MEERTAQYDRGDHQCNRIDSHPCQVRTAVPTLFSLLLFFLFRLSSRKVLVLSWRSLDLEARGKVNGIIRRICVRSMVFATLYLFICLFIYSNADKKMAHSASKSSKSKKAKQKAKGKVESTDNGSWRQEREPKQESDAINDAQTPDKSSDKSKETEPNSCESTEIQQGVDTPRSEKKGIIKLQDESAEKGSVIETVEKNENKNGTVEKGAVELKEAVTFAGNTDVSLARSEGANLADGYESEKKTTAVVVQLQPVMPLRSRGEFQTPTFCHSLCFPCVERDAAIKVY